jgi:hypothetical protein
MSIGSRKAKRNLGGTDAENVEPFFNGPVLAEARTNIILVERVLQLVLQTEIDRLAATANQSELERFFSHFYDPIAGETERARFVTNFQRQPPKATIGYPRSTSEFPCFSIILESEEETQNVLADYVGQTLDDEDAREAAEYHGAVFSQTYGVYIYAQHPDVAAYLYQFAKLVLFGAKPFLQAAGLIEPHFSGGELSPEEMYLPDNMFARVLRITAQAVISVPVLLDPDPLRVRLAGLFMNDVVVRGIRGSVTPYTDTGDDD